MISTDAQEVSRSPGPALAHILADGDATIVKQMRQLCTVLATIAEVLSTRVVSINSTTSLGSFLGSFLLFER